MEDCYSDSYTLFSIHVCIHTLLSSSQLQGLEDSNILLEHNDVWSCQTPNHNRPETGSVDGFPRPFSKSLLRNVLVEYAVLVSQLLVKDSPPQLHGWSTRTTETRSLWCILWTCKVGRRIVPTGRTLLLIDLGALIQSTEYVIITGHKHFEAPFFGSPCKSSRHVRSC